MSDSNDQTPSLRLLIPAAAVPDPAAAKTPPPFLQTASSRGGPARVDPLLACVQVTASYDLARSARSGDAPVPKEEDADDRLLLLEAMDGTTVIMRADRLAQEIRRLYPEAEVDGAVDLARFRDPRATSRGLDDWLWRSVKVVSLKADQLVEAAKQQAIGWVQEKLGLSPGQWAYDAGSWLGAKALMHVIESQLPDQPGLYRWDGGALQAGDLMAPGDPRLAAASAQGPLLVFIHGTGSTTLGGFGHLPRATDDWKALTNRYPGRVFAFEHRTFSQSPIENAVALAECLPDHAEVVLVTHLRGGLVGDLVALGSLDAQTDRRLPHAPGPGRGGSSCRRPHRLRQRRARTALPAEGAPGQVHGGPLRAGGRSGARHPSAVGQPGPGPVTADARPGGRGCPGRARLERAAALKRLVLEIAQRRLDPRLVPGIEAMLMDAPLGVLLANAQRDPTTAMMVIAGDTEFEGLLGPRMQWRLVSLFADWALFDRTDNDLVVDTDSMFGGLALGRTASAACSTRATG